MKLKTLLIGCFGGFIMLNSCTESPSVKDYSAYVNPFIGTGIPTSAVQAVVTTEMYY